MPKVSVIIPNYNHARFLNQRIDSVLNQSFQDFEVIILDDCSTDNSREIIEAYREHPKVSHVIFNEQNSGSPFAQWYRGFGVTNGELIWIAESDDYASVDFLEKLIPYINAATGLAYCDSLETDEDGRQLGRWSRWQDHFSENIWISDFERGGEWLNENYHSLYNIIPNASSAIFKRNLVPPQVAVSEVVKMRYVGDWYVWQLIFKKTQVYYHHQALNYFRNHPSSTRADQTLLTQKATEYYRALKSFLSQQTVRTKSADLERRLSEIFDAWKLGAKSLLKISVWRSLLIAYSIDKKIFSRVFDKILNTKSGAQ
ncbi:hypothetical protein BCY91_12210 [Pelobium manganitolerans]|uniref:Glycosyltransferase 2-like domain-containing protein n=1 Tax=Pelobium manganitolerans TaxID=1842495 RepID=A0A419S1Q6_9SPHI|nr:glycosyltransferase family 2 protein [Pelobium manganitolerans]RKD12407.1 hypothetical protein BCY91_12210 [Pelobium manganitolerans]